MRWKGLVDMYQCAGTNYNPFKQVPNDVSQKQPAGTVIIQVSYSPEVLLRYRT